MERKFGQIAEYGTTEFENNKSVYTVLDTGKTVNPHGIVRDCELYHRTEGYKPAGSCAVYSREVWGVKIYFGDGTTGGNMYYTESEARNYWKSLPR